MPSLKKLYRPLQLLLIGMSFAFPGGASAEEVYDIRNAEPMYVLTYNKATLISQYGCQEVPTEDRVNDLGFVAFVIPDGQVLIKTVESETGQNAQATKKVFAFAWAMCTEAQAEAAYKSQPQIETGITLEGVQYYAAQIISSVLWMVAEIGLWLLQLASKLLFPVLTAGAFITNDIVQKGWPFIQGLANLGFILALLAIAALTVLRIDVGGGVKRLLPRLLIAALLINFSLVIGGVIIDSSRVVMAISWQILKGSSGATPDKLGARIIDNSQLMKNVFCPVGSGANASCVGGSFELQGKIYTTWDGVLKVAEATIFIWVITGALLVLAIMLFIRHVALLLLLIVSPLAYLAAAMPAAGKFASQWWENFLRYVIYGPVVMLILTIIAALTESESAGAGIDVKSSSLRNIMEMSVVTVLIIVAATAGKYVGMYGAGAAVGFVKGLPGRAARNPKKTAALAAGIATGGLGLVPSLAAAGGTAYGIRRTQDAWKKFQTGRKKTQEKKEKASFMQRAGEVGFRKATKEARGRNEAFRDARVQGDLSRLSRAELTTNPALSPEKLANPSFLTGLGKSNIQEILKRGTRSQRVGIAASVGSMKQESPAMKTVIDGVINQQTFDVYNSAQQVINDPTATQGAKDKAANEIDGINRVLRSLANNEKLVDKMDAGQIQQMLEHEDTKTTDDLLKSLSKTRSSG
ncbi:MAG: hypothetical protein HYR90_05040 [Candidatus Andersenbacteria bacterium]|nr:hypothetical protein [Candidatus Andersenbacteria bacterium]MBI3250745.1 hypothetical protein [Candidatus Andersenbacteria bacterium]